MGARLVHPHACTVLYPWDVALILNLSDWIPGYILLLLIGVGFLASLQRAIGSMRSRIPRTYRRASNLLTRWSRWLSQSHHFRWLANPRPRSPRPREPQANLTPQAALPREPQSPRQRQEPLPSSLAILTHVPYLPQGFVRALEGYQLQPYDDSK